MMFGRIQLLATNCCQRAPQAAFNNGQNPSKFNCYKVRGEISISIPIDRLPVITNQHLKLPSVTLDLDEASVTNLLDDVYNDSDSEFRGNNPS